MAHRRSKNKVNIMGNSTADFEFLPGTNNAVSFTLVSNEVWRDKQSGQMQEKAEFHRCVAFGKTAEYLVNHGRKGSLVDVEGKLQTRKWQDQAGQDRYTTEIVCNGDVQIIDGWKSDNSQNTSQGHQQQPAGSVPNNQGYSQPVPQSASNPAMDIPDGYYEDQVPGFQN